MTDIGESSPCGLSEAAINVLRDVRRPSLASISIGSAAVFIDMAVLSVALWFAQYAAVPSGEFSPVGAVAIAALATLFAATGMILTSSYAPHVLRKPWRALARLAMTLTLPVGVLGLVLPGSATSFLPAALIAVVAVAIPLRLCAAAFINWAYSMRLLDRRAVIAGGGEHALALLRGLNEPAGGVRIFGIFDDRDDIRSPTQVMGVPKLGDYGDLVAFIRRSEIDMVIIALPLEAEERIAWLLDAFRVLPVEVRLSAFSRDYAFARTERVPLISAIRRSFGPECRLVKRSFDIIFALLALLICMPLMAAAALAIRIDSRGPILFRQRRHGYNDRVIEVLKFRSMYHDLADPEARKVVTRGDARVTRVGRILRRSSIDELPQLFNVLKGDLSLVGPRPHAVDARSSGEERFARIVEGYSARHRLPPGITGWAQINGWRGEIDEPGKLRCRFEHDLFYIENWSIWFDLKILLRTPLSLLDGRSAY